MNINPSRMTAQMDGDFVVFLIGMRFNKPWKFWKWGTVFSAMPKMLKELATHPEMGYLSSELWFGRTTLLVQYWRSTDDLIAYATNRDAEHLPAWKAFNQKIGTSGDVGIWHETYAVKAGASESVYVNMPKFGLGKAGKLVPVTAGLSSAKHRLRTKNGGGGGS